MQSIKVFFKKKYSYLLRTTLKLNQHSKKSIPKKPADKRHEKHHQKKKTLSLKI